MTTTDRSPVKALSVILDQLLAPVPGGIGRYTRELGRALVVSAPAGWEVHGLVAAASRTRLRSVAADVPGLAQLHRLPADRRILARAWERGLPPSPHGRGPVHGMSLLAPLGVRRPARSPRAVVATIHDVVPWTHPETLTARGVAWHRAMASRAERFADAVVVPSHAVAGELADLFDLGDRIHVVPGAPSDDLLLPADHDRRAAALSLPDRFVLAVGTLEPRKGLRHVVEAMGASEAAGLPLLIAGPGGWGGVDVAGLAEAAGVSADRVRALGHVSEADLAVLYDRATVFVMPSLAEGFGLPIVEAFAHGTPVVHSDAPALVEVAGGAGITVPTLPADSYGERLAGAIAEVLEAPATAERMSARGRARASDFTWNDSAARVWQLHLGLSG